MRSTRSVLSIAILLAATIGLAGQGFISNLEAFLQLSGRPAAASSAVLSEHEREEIGGMSAQDQVMRLLERTINHYSGASEEIEKRGDAWLGRIQTTPELTNLSNVAYFSNDLRVRAAALEIWRIQAGFLKSSETVDQIINAAATDPERKYFFLSQLGILGNRGVQRQKVFETLMLYVHDPDGSIRAAAINGLALLGTEDTIAPLLEIFHSDPSHDLRERAACNLADSGMLSRELRKTAVPELIRFSQDPSLDQTTKKWVYQALREITQQQIGNDSSAWLGWYGSQAGRR
jgi:hypothetical protein